MKEKHFLNFWAMKVKEKWLYWFSLQYYRLWKIKGTKKNYKKSLLLYKSSKSSFCAIIFYFCFKPSLLLPNSSITFLLVIFNFDFLFQLCIPEIEISSWLVFSELIYLAATACSLFASLPAWTRHFARQFHLLIFVGIVSPISPPSVEFFGVSKILVGCIFNYAINTKPPID